jgi:hypothetical protein
MKGSRIMQINRFIFVYLLAFIPAFLCTSLFPQRLLAQTLTGRGIKAGLNISYLSEATTDTYSDTDNDSTMLGSCIGGSMRYSVNALFAFNPEIFYITRGRTYTKRDTGEVYVSHEKIKGIEVPILGLFVLPSISIDLFTGPAITYDLFGHTDQPIVMSWILGTGYEIPLSHGMLLFDVRYDHNGWLLNSLTHKNFEVKNGTWSFLIGYSFD